MKAVPTEQLNGCIDQIASNQLSVSKLPDLHSSTTGLGRDAKQQAHRITGYAMLIIISMKNQHSGYELIMNKEIADRATQSIPTEKHKSKSNNMNIEF